MRTSTLEPVPNALLSTPKHLPWITELKRLQRSLRVGFSRSIPVEFVPCDFIKQEKHWKNTPRGCCPVISHIPPCACTKSRRLRLHFNLQVGQHLIPGCDFLESHPGVTPAGIKQRPSAGTRPCPRCVPLLSGGKGRNPRSPHTG